MVDVSLRDKVKVGAGVDAPRLRPRRRTPQLLLRPAAIAVATIAVAATLVIGGRAAIDSWHENVVLSGLATDPTPVELTIAAERLSIPANMIRSAKTRRGGAVERVELALHWPTLQGYTDALAEAFRDAAPDTPIVYLTIAPRDMPLDSTDRLEAVYARFFVGKAEPGPGGLVGRRLAGESGYGGEMVYFAPSDSRPFVARCPVEATAEMPATCLRDVNLGRGLSLTYRFDRSLLGDWRDLDSGLGRLSARFLAR
jgi:hypothetical protein